MKVTEIVTEALAQTAKEKADADYVKSKQDAMNPEQREKLQAAREAALAKHREMIARRHAKNCPEGEHKWEVASDNHKGHIKYRCTKCPATKSRDSSD